MTDLEQHLSELLDQRADAVDVHDRFAEILGGPVVPLRPRRSHRRAMALVGAAAAAVLAVTGVVLAVRGYGPERAAVLSPAPPVTLGPIEAVPDPNGAFVASDHVDRGVNIAGGAYSSGSSVRVEQVVPYGDGYLAVGTTQIGFRSEASVWRSPDGRGWERVALPASAPVQAQSERYGEGLTHVAVGGSRIVALGMAFANEMTGQVTAWTSDDGVAWQRHIVDATLGNNLTMGIAATDAGFVAVTLDNNDPETGATTRSHAYVSADGNDWSRIEATSLDQPGTYVHGLVTLGERLIAFGSVGGFFGRAAAWVSDDNGRTWVAMTLPDGGGLPFRTVRHATVNAGSVVLIGDASTEETFVHQDGPALVVTGRQQIAAWVSTDGVGYEPLPTPPTATLDMVRAAAAGPAGVVIGVDTLGTDGEWASLLRWSTAGGFIPIDTAGLGIRSITTLTRVDGGYLLTGSGQQSSDVTGDSTHLWFIPLG